MPEMNRDVALALVRRMPWPEPVFATATAHDDHAKLVTVFPYPKAARLYENHLNPGTPFIKLTYELILDLSDRGIEDSQETINKLFNDITIKPSGESVPEGERCSYGTCRQQKKIEVGPYEYCRRHAGVVLVNELVNAETLADYPIVREIKSADPQQHKQGKR